MFPKVPPPISSKHNQYLRAQGILLKSISSHVKSTQSILFSAFLQRPQEANASLIALNNNLNGYLSQLTKENELLASQYTAVSNLFNALINSKAHFSLEKIQLASFVLENKIAQQRNVNSRLMKKLNTLQANPFIREKNEEIALLNNGSDTNEVLETALSSTREQMKEQSKGRNEYINKLKTLKQQIELIKEDIQLIEKKEASSINITEMANEEDLTGKKEQVSVVNVYEPFEPQSPKFSINNSVELTIENEKDNKKSHSQIDLFFKTNAVNAIPKLNLGNITKKTSLKVHVPRLSTLHTTNKTPPDTIQQLKKENEESLKVIEGFKAWCRSISPEVFYKIMKTSNHNQ